MLELQYVLLELTLSLFQVDASCFSCVPLTNNVYLFSHLALNRMLAKLSHKDS